MTSCERDGQVAAACLFDVDRTAPSVITVHTHAGGHRHPGSIENRRHRSGDGADVRTPLADVVKKGCLYRSLIIGQDGVNTPSNVDGVPLIGEVLGPEQLGARTVEVFVYEALISGTRGLGA